MKKLVNIFMGIFLIATIITLCYSFKDNTINGVYKQIISNHYSYLEYYQKLTDAGLAGRSDFYSFETIIFDDITIEKENIIDTSIEKGILIPNEGSYWMNQEYTFKQLFDVNIPDDVKEDAQQIILNNNEGDVTNIYLFTGKEWEKSSNIYYVAQKNAIYVLPEQYYNTFKTNSFACANTPIEKITSWNLNLHTDETLNKLYNNHNLNRLKNFEVMFFLLILGTLVLIPVMRLSKGKELLYIWTAIPMGLSLIILETILLSVLNIKIRIIMFLLFTFIIALLESIFLLNDKHRKNSLDICSIIKSLCIQIIVISFFSFFSFSYVSNDTSVQVALGRNIAREGNVINCLDSVLAYSWIGPTIETISELFGCKFLYAFHPVIAFVSCTICLIFFIRISKLYCIKHQYLYSLFFIILFAGTPMYIISGAVKLNNLCVGMYFAISLVYILDDYFVTKERGSYILLFILLFVAGIARLEGSIFIIIFLTLMWQINNNLIALKMSAIICFAYSMILIWEVKIIGWKSEGIFWKASNATLMVACVVIFTIVEYLLIKYRKFKWLSSNLQNVVLGVIVLLCLLLSILNMEKTKNDIQAFLYNIRYYGIFFTFCLVVAGLYWVYGKRHELVNRIIIYIVEYTLAIFGILRLGEWNLRKGWGDSGCRMLLHILPSAGIVIFIVFTHLKKNINIQQEERIKLNNVQSDNNYTDL